MTIHLLKPGVTSGGMARELQRAGQVMRITNATALGHLGAEYAIFTPALLYALLPLGKRDPLAEFVTLTGAAEPFWLNFPQRIFTGLSSEFAEWHARLGFVAIEHADTLRSFFGRAVYTDSETGLVARVRWQTIHIPDPITVARATSVPQHGWPLVAVQAMALATNQYRAYMRGQRFTHDYVIEDETALFAQAVQAGSDDMYGFVENCIAAVSGATPEEQRLAKLPTNEFVQTATAAAVERLSSRLKEELKHGDREGGDALPDSGI
jgi:hypothetical protein